MKKKWLTLIIVLMMVTLVIPASATRREGISGVVEFVDTLKITVSSKSYRISKQFRVVVVSRVGIHHYEKVGVLSDIRVGDKVSGAVLYDEITDIYLERY
jgi:hypothetical protein